MSRINNPRRCPLLKGGDFICTYNDEEKSICDTQDYLGCEYFSRWYWDSRIAKSAQLDLVMNKLTDEDMRYHQRVRLV